MSNTSHLWSPLQEDKIRPLLSSKSFDIDYICVRDSLETILASEEFARLVGSGSGQVYKSGHGLKLRDGCGTVVYCIGDIGEFKVGIHLWESGEHEEDSSCIAVEEDEVAAAGLSGQRNGINALLQKALPGRLPLSQFKVSVN